MTPDITTRVCHTEEESERLYQELKQDLYADTDFICSSRVDEILNACARAESGHGAYVSALRKQEDGTWCLSIVRYVYTEDSFEDCLFAVWEVKTSDQTIEFAMWDKPVIVQKDPTKYYEREE